jgi:polyhydroxyalkanoate synthase
VLGASGHIAGVINPASKNKRNYWAWKLADKAAAKKAAAKSAVSRNARAASKADIAVFPPSAEDWLEQAESVPGSWWTHWNQWLQQFQGLQVKAPAKYGAGKYKTLEPAPGRYVKLRVA